MVELKSDKLSEAAKAEGNKKFRNGDFYDALLCYNKALCYAISKELVSLAYANRSAVFLELKKYDECLQNIEWARDGYPAEKIQKLDEREENCKRLKDEHVDVPGENLWNFFKLSHPPNPKIPFIINSLYVQKTEKFGRGIYTSCDLKVGDIVAIDKEALPCLYNAGRYCRCCNCTESAMMNLIPCEKNASVMFCSTKCRDEIYKHIENYDILMTNEYNNMEKVLIECDKAFGNRQNLLKFIDENDLARMDKTIFDFDWNDENDPKYKENLIKCIISLDSRTNRNRSREMTKRAKLLSKGNAKIEMFLKHMGIICYNNCSYRQNLPKVGTFNFNVVDESIMVRTFMSLLNHSCDPNVMVVEAGDVYSFVTCSKPIKAGEQLFYNYLLGIGNISREARKDLFQQEYQFSCDCFMCLLDSEYTYPREAYPLLLGEMWNSRCHTFTVGKSRKRIIRQIKKNFKLLNFYNREQPTMEWTQLMSDTHIMLFCLSMYLSYPCLKSKLLEHPFRYS